MVAVLLLAGLGGVGTTDPSWSALPPDRPTLACGSTVRRTPDCVVFCGAKALTAELAVRADC